MNDQNTRPKAVKLDDAEGLDLCRQLRDLRREARQTTEELNKRYSDEADAMNAAFERRSKELWDKLYAKAGIDPEANWTVDTEYLDDHGVAFVKEDEPCQHGGMPAALAQLFGGANVRLVEEPVEEPTLN
jgi:hypothetical protein